MLGFWAFWPPRQKKTEKQREGGRWGERFFLNGRRMVGELASKAKNLPPPVSCGMVDLGKGAAAAVDLRAQSSDERE
jgi:hypothetical protein